MSVMTYDRRYLSSVISDTFSRPFEFPIEALSGSTWAYPFFGIYYFITHPNLWTPALGILIPQVLISIIVFTFFHIWFYPPQAIVAAFFNGPTGLITSWIAVLQQAGIASRFIIDKTILPGPLKEIFDSVLRQNGSLALSKQLHDLNEKERKAAQIVDETPFDLLLRQRLASAFATWVSYLQNPYYWIKFGAIVLFNLIPFFGPYVLIFLRSPGKARSLHARYFAIEGFSPEDINVFFNAHRPSYTSFGVVALNLELIPVIGMFFTYTNIVAAALWASQLKKNKEQETVANMMR